MLLSKVKKGVRVTIRKDYDPSSLSKKYYMDFLEKNPYIIIAEDHIYNDPQGEYVRVKSEDERLLSEFFHIKDLELIPDGWIYDKSIVPKEIETDVEIDKSPRWSNYVAIMKDGGLMGGRYSHELQQWYIDGSRGKVFPDAWMYLPFFNKDLAEHYKNISRK